MARLRVLHLTGSPTDAFFADLSLLYARACWDAAADPDRYEFRAAVVRPGGAWRLPDGLSDDAIDAAPDLSLAEAVAALAGAGLDVALPQLFCLPGMTTYRALLDALGLPYVGNTPDVMALGAHKARARAVVADAGVRVPRGEVVAPGALPSLAMPLVVKPVDADNSHGVTLVRSPDELGPAVEEAARHGSAVLAEAYVELGREVRCGVVERAGELVALPLEEYAVDAARKPIRDAADKLRRGGSGVDEGVSDGEGELSLVAKDAERAWIVDVDDPVTAVVQDAARRCYRALGCRDHGLFDFRVDPDGVPHFLEAGLYCSFAPTSVVVVMAAAAGIGLDALLADGIALALGRAARSGPA